MNALIVTDDVKGAATVGGLVVVPDSTSSHGSDGNGSNTSVSNNGSSSNSNGRQL